MTTASSSIDDNPWRILAPTRQKLWRLFIGWLMIGAGTALAMYVIAILAPGGVMIGGDFAAFFVAAKEVAAGHVTEIYQAAYFEDRLNATFPGRDDLQLSWQYPPTYLLLLVPVALTTHLVGYGLWSTGTGAIYVGSLRRFTDDRLIWFAVLASPAAFTAFITGQNGFLTAALLILATYKPKTRVLLAGFAAGLLTVKPHLGLLIPVVYIAAGCWRAAFIATLTACALIALSVLAYGADAWIAFYHSITEVSTRLSDQIMPLAKMATPYSALMFAGLPELMARIGAGIVAIGVCVLVARFWRLSDDPYLRSAIVIAGVLMTAPYGYHYEIIMLAFPMVIIASRALKHGWLPYERALLAAAWATPLFSVTFADTARGLSVGFVAVLIAFVIILRRAHHAAPSLLPWTAPKLMAAR